MQSESKGSDGGDQMAEWRRPTGREELLLQAGRGRRSLLLRWEEGVVLLLQSRELKKEMRSGSSQQDHKLEPACVIGVEMFAGLGKLETTGQNKF